MAKIKVTVSFEEDDIEYLDEVAEMLGDGEPLDRSKTIREVVGYHKQHPAAKKYRNHERKEGG